MNEPASAGRRGGLGRQLAIYAALALVLEAVIAVLIIQDDGGFDSAWPWLRFVPVFVALLLALLLSRVIHWIRPRWSRLATIVGVVILLLGFSVVAVGHIEPLREAIDDTFTKERRKELTEADFEEIYGRTHAEIMPQIHDCAARLKELARDLSQGFPGGFSDVSTRAELQLMSEQAVLGRGVAEELEWLADEYERRFYISAREVSGSDSVARQLTQRMDDGVLQMFREMSHLLQGLFDTSIQIDDLCDEYWGEWRWNAEVGEMTSENAVFMARYEPLSAELVEGIVDLLVFQMELESDEPQGSGP